jgi:hypothetical protein
LIARFSELSVTYEITINEQTGEVRTETFYTIGQVQQLWAFIFGIPISVSPYAIAPTMGMAAVHYVTIFTSNYRVVSGSGTTIDTGIQAPIGTNMTIEIGNRNVKALQIGFRGEFDLVNESANNAVVSNGTALNVIVPARPADSALVAWQAGFSKDVMCLMAYGLSSNIRANYTSPQDLRNRGAENFHKSKLWYAVCFPHFEGLRIVHDPTYTAYTNAKSATSKTKTTSLEPVVVVGVIALTSVAYMARRRRRAP